MNGFIGVTDNDWFAFLSQKPGIDEVNFWQPSGKSPFQALKPGEPFLFKLHAPHHYIVRGGFFAHSTTLPISLAWEAFGEKRCIILIQPFFF
jgi:putative restriction endonuclease